MDENNLALQSIPLVGCVTMFRTTDRQRIQSHIVQRHLRIFLHSQTYDIKILSDLQSSHISKPPTSLIFNIRYLPIEKLKGLNFFSTIGCFAVDNHPSDSSSQERRTPPVISQV